MSLVIYSFTPSLRGDVQKRGTFSGVLRLGSDPSPLTDGIAQPEGPNTEPQNFQFILNDVFFISSLCLEMHPHKVLQPRLVLGRIDRYFLLEAFSLSCCIEVFLL